MLKIRLASMHCDEETSELSDSDEPYILVAAVALSPAVSDGAAQAPLATDAVVYAFSNVDQGRDYFGSVGSRFDAFWGIGGNPAPPPDPNNVIFIVAMMENDDGDPQIARGYVDAAVSVSVVQSLALPRPAKVALLLNDVNSARRIPSGLPNFDDTIGDCQELVFSADELRRAQLGETVTKTMIFEGDGGRYTLGFEAVNAALDVNTLFVAWKGVGDDGRLFLNTSADGLPFGQQRGIGGTGSTSQGPSLAQLGNRLFVAWKGTGQDSRLFLTASANGEDFRDQYLIEGAGGTSHRPAIAAFGKQLFVAWKGVGDDNRLFFSCSEDGEHFALQQIIPGTGGTSHGPALVEFSNRLFVVWKGAGNDGRLFFSSSQNGQNFTDQRVVPGTGGTSHEPALAVFGDQLFIAWKGVDEDSRLFLNSYVFDQASNEQPLVPQHDQRIIQNTGGSSHGPALGVMGGKLFVAWKGVNGDDRLFYNASNDGNNFSDQRVIEGTGGTSHGPALASLPAR